MAAETKPAKPAKPAEPVAKAPAPAKPASAALEPGNYYINIGVFSEAANAGRVVERLEKAKLPTLSQTLHSNKGEIVRVRSGPFAKQRSADQAAARIRAMGLEATVFHHAPRKAAARGGDALAAPWQCLRDAFAAACYFRMPMAPPEPG